MTEEDPRLESSKPGQEFSRKAPRGLDTRFKPSGLITVALGILLLILTLAGIGTGVVPVHEGSKCKRRGLHRMVAP